MRILRCLLLLAALWPVTSYADTLASPNFRIDESFVGGGGDVRSSSTNFKSDSAIGSAAIGDSASTSFQSSAGYITTSDPALSFNVSGTSINFGALSTSVPSTANSTFTIRNYTSYGYIVQVVGSPPKTGIHTLTGMAAPGASAPGTEQFGINLVHNTSPINFGLDPIAGTSASSLGVASVGYNTTNTYKYVSGDTVASAPKSSGETDYTISYIVNASTTTAGGSYSGSLTLVCTGTY